jgi:hypothetical protein
MPLYDPDPVTPTKQETLYSLLNASPPPPNRFRCGGS